MTTTTAIDSLAAELAEMRKQVVRKICRRDVTMADLDDAFTRVADKANWKNPIDAVVALHSDFEMLTLREAVIFHTGSVPRIDALGRNRYRVTAVGYYVAVGA